jgi:predicted RNase H-like nuclease (RuvC/YqgF family)
VYTAYVIAGIDPGKTVGIACIDLRGNIVLLEHMAFAGEEWIIQRISSIGTPVLIASDKPTHSFMIDKTNAAFNSTLFYPQRVLRTQEKRELAKATRIKNVHERDAYVAAIKAFNAYKSKFMQIESSVDPRSIDAVKAKVIKKYSIKEAVENRKAGRR